MSLKMSLELPLDLNFISAARASSESILHKLTIHEDDIDKVNLVIGELCTNAATHSHTTHRASYKLEIDYGRDYLDIVVIDKGIGFNREDVPTPDLEAEGGRGIWMVEALSERVEFQRIKGGGTCVSARIHLRQCDPPDKVDFLS